MATAARRVWTDTDRAQRPEILERVRAILEEARGTDGLIVLETGIRYTLITGSVSASGS